jgi:hypothetical protein
MALITLAQAQRHLRLEVTIDHGSPAGSPPPDDSEMDLELKMAQAEAIVLDYLARPTEMASWSSDPVPLSPYTTVPAVVQAAILIVLGDLWRFRGDDPEGVMPKREHGFLTPQVTSLLQRYRDPALA